MCDPSSARRPPRIHARITTRLVKEFGLDKIQQAQGADTDRAGDGDARSRGGRITAGRGEMNRAWLAFRYATLLCFQRASDLHARVYGEFGGEAVGFFQNRDREGAAPL